MKNGRHKQGGNSQPWLVTFADMTLVILVLFVLLYSYSEVDVEKFQSIIGSFQKHSLMEDGSGFLDEDGNVILPDDLEQQFADMLEREANIREVLAYVDTYASDHGLEGKLTVTPTERGIEVVLPEVMLFPSGQATLLDEAIAFLDDMAPLLNDISNALEVEGHTDDRPISTERFPSNWDLSTARANEVIKYLIETHGLNPKRFKAVGYGEFHPIATNKTAEGRSQNRRVVMLITKDQ